MTDAPRPSRPRPAEPGPAAPGSAAPRRSAADLDRARQRSVMIGWMIGFADLVPTTAAAVISNSVVLWAGLARSTVEATANFLAWLTLRKVGQGRSLRYNYGFGKLENVSSLLVAGAMFLSSGVFLLMSIERFLHPEPAERVWLGILILLAAAAINIKLWLQNRRLAQEAESPVMESQWRVFRSKTILNVCVVSALILGRAFRDHAWAAYLDPLATLLVTGVLFRAGIGILSKSVPGLLDRTLDASLLQLIEDVVRRRDDAFAALAGIDARRAGGDVFVEIRLAFDPGRTMAAVQDVAEDVTRDVEAAVHGAHAYVVTALASDPR